MLIQALGRCKFLLGPDSVLIVSSLFPQVGEGWNYDVCDRVGNTHTEQSQPSSHPCLPEAARLKCPLRITDSYMQLVFELSHSKVRISLCSWLTPVSGRAMLVGFLLHLIF